MWDGEGCRYLWHELGVPVDEFPADWKQYGRSAGHIRNREMAVYADILIVFPGGKGTENMMKQAGEHGLKTMALETNESLENRGLGHMTRPLE